MAAISVAVAVAFQKAIEPRPASQQGFRRSAFFGLSPLKTCRSVTLGTGFLTVKGTSNSFAGDKFLADCACQRQCISYNQSLPANC